MASGVRDTFNKTGEIEKIIRQSAQRAITRLCNDTVAAAKVHITTQVYDTPESATYRRTGAARESIFAHTPETNNYPEAIASARSMNPREGVIDDIELNHNPNLIEGIAGAGMDYSVHIEFGTEQAHVSVPPRPFMTPAAEQVGPTSGDVCHEELVKGMARI
jgi:molybdopterin-guanine dinucleotide biosynthesis protein